MELSLKEETVPTSTPITPRTLEGVLGVVGLCDVLLGNLTTRDASTLRAASTLCLGAVREHRWNDRDTVIMGSIALWRACFPRALAACVRQQLGASASLRNTHPSPPSRRTPVQDSDLQYLQHLSYLCLAECTQLTAYGMQYLRASAPSMVFLDVSGCVSLCDAAFRSLAGIQGIDISGCSQPGITGAALAHLAGVRTLFMCACAQPSMNGAALAPLLPHLRLLDTTYCGWLGEEFGAILTETKDQALGDAALFRAIVSARAAGSRAVPAAEAAWARAAAQAGDEGAAECLRRRHAGGGGAGGGGQ